MVKKYNAYHKLDANITSLNAQTGQYYYDLKNGNIGKFDEIYRKMEAGDINNATLLNNQIAPVNSLEQYRKWVNAVYFDYIVTQKEIPQNIIVDLEALASSSPFVMGDAVYTARAIVGYIDPDVNPKNLKQENDVNNSSEITAKVYPNPANEYITVKIVGNAEKSIKFVLTNMLGIKVLEKLIEISNSTYKIDVHQLSQGIYIYEALYKISGVSIIKGRIVIN